MEAALKMGFVKEMGFKSSPKVCLDEFLSLNAENAASSSDYFFVDQLLNFSNDEDGFMEEEEAEEAEEKNIHHSFSVSANSLQQHHENDENSNHSSTSSEDDFWPVSSRDSEDLEWLSHLVADSSQEYSAPPSCVFLTEKSNNNQNEIKITRQHLHPLLKFGISSMEPHLKIPFPSKPRSQRARISGRVWSFVSPLRSDTSSRGSVSVTSSSSCSSLSIPWLNYHHPLEKVPAKKPKKKSTVESSVRVQQARRCSHCGVQKTPQWRAGPLGGKTLCNACGVRFKSGRLFPEYRPACSPTFSSELHSNHHRKVLEMRRQKETEKHHSGPDPDPTVKEPEERTRFKERPSLVCK